ncbi:hypothetical protein [Gordonia jacobaea]
MPDNSIPGLELQEIGDTRGITMPALIFTITRALQRIELGAE